jgi:cytidine deaminase
LPASRGERVSIAVHQVKPEAVERYARLAGERLLLMARKGHGTGELLVDPSRPHTFIQVQRWHDDDARRRFEAEDEARALEGQLAQTMVATAIVDNARRVDAERPGERALLDAARDARERAHARFSRFNVGAAIETASGDVITGCNVENATYGLTVCAERVAVFKAISEGHRSFRRVAVVADTDKLTPPCGACRQILWEFGGNLDVVLGNLTGDVLRLKMLDLLPLPFDASFLDEP